MNKKILITGGTGYIGSHTIVQLIENGYDVISIDNYINSSDKPLKSIEAITKKSIPNYVVDLCERDAVDEVFQQHRDIVGVIHFAALKAVGESVEKPLLYYRNNITGLINLLELCRKYQIANFIFSSSCSVYGNVDSLPVTEDTPISQAESPYAHTKQIGEDIVRNALKGTGIQSILLRYFNPSGAHPSGLMGESPIVPAHNLVPVITELAAGIRTELTVFGTDYDTRDGSCIRDYIHVVDLANAHVKAMDFMMAGQQKQDTEVFNLGIGQGVSVLEAIAAFEEISNIKLNITLGPRREGDVIAVYADYSKAKQELGWVPQYSIQDIMKTAWAWQQKRVDNHPLT